MEQKNADGSESNVKEFTNLLGSQKKKLLKGLPSKLSDLLYPDTSNTVQRIWKDFEELNSLACTDFNTADPSEVLFPKAQTWINLFRSL